MKSKKPPIKEQLTPKEFFLRFPGRKAQLAGSTLEQFVRRISVEPQVSGRVEAYLMMSVRAYKDACDFTAAQSPRELELQVGIEKVKAIRLKVTQLKTENKLLKNENDKLAPVRKEVAALNADRQQVKLLLVEAEELLKSLRQRAR